MRTIWGLYDPGLQRKVFKFVPKCKWIPLTKIPWTSPIDFSWIPQRANIAGCSGFHKSKRIAKNLSEFCKCKWISQTLVKFAKSKQIPQNVSKFSKFRCVVFFSLYTELNQSLTKQLRAMA